ncbi:MAG TPA: SigE family RNA polymerase sigma factor [Jatrophihabitans sp.]|nr:SigE family RNA polymerase sigma factor [Jatrophihabitans sp.]
MTALGMRRSVVGGQAPPGSFDELYQAQWWPMLRLATGLVDQVTVAEDVVQDAFAAVYRKWSAIREPAAAIGYLRTAVVNGSRTALRRRIVARRHLRSVGEETVEGADASTVLSAEHELVRAALAGLPDRQREVLTLRYLAELSDPEIAAATGLSLGGVRSASSRGLAALRTSLGGRL